MLVQPKVIDRAFPDFLPANMQNCDCLCQHNLQQQIKQWTKLVPDFCQIGEFFIVAHDRFVSVYSNQEWLFHEQFPDQVFFITPVGMLSPKEYEASLKEKKKAMESVNPSDKLDEEDKQSDGNEYGDEYYDDDSEQTKDFKEPSESTAERYLEGEILFQVRVMYGLGKCAELTFPRSINRKDYRENKNFTQQE